MASQSAQNKTRGLHLRSAKGFDGGATSGFSPKFESSKEFKLASSKKSSYIESKTKSPKSSYNTESKSSPKNSQKSPEKSLLTFTLSPENETEIEQIMSPEKRANKNEYTPLIPTKTNTVSKTTTSKATTILSKSTHYHFQTTKSGSLEYDGKMVRWGTNLEDFQHRQNLENYGRNIGSGANHPLLSDPKSTSNVPGSYLMHTKPKYIGKQKFSFDDSDTEGLFREAEEPDTDSQKVFKPKPKPIPKGLTVWERFERALARTLSHRGGIIKVTPDVSRFVRKLLKMKERKMLESQAYGSSESHYYMTDDNQRKRRDLEYELRFGRPARSFETSDPGEVLPHLFIGSLQCSNESVLRRYGIEYVVNACATTTGLVRENGKELTAASNPSVSAGTITTTPEGFTTFSLALSDHPKFSLNKKCMDQVVSFVDTARRNRKNCLIFCARGVSRCATVMCWYLLASRAATSFSSALCLVQRVRPVCDPNHGFRKQLRALETEIRDYEFIANRVEHLESTGNKELLEVLKAGEHLKKGDGEKGEDDDRFESEMKGDTEMSGGRVETSEATASTNFDSCGIDDATITLPKPVNATTTASINTSSSLKDAETISKSKSNLSQKKKTFKRSISVAMLCKK